MGVSLAVQVPGVFEGLGQAEVVVLPQVVGVLGHRVGVVHGLQVYPGDPQL